MLRSLMVLLISLVTVSTYRKNRSLRGRTSNMRHAPLYAPDLYEKGDTLTKAVIFEGNLVDVILYDGVYIIEGDIIVGKALRRREQIQRVTPVQLLGVEQGKDWQCPVPYTFSGNISPQSRIAVGNAIRHWEDATHWRFVEQTTEEDFIEFANHTGCSSAIGRQGGKQQVLLSAGCGTGTTIHEIGHAIGLYHEHSRPDRDVYIEVKWDNMALDIIRQQINFQIAYNPYIIGDYDFLSIMHYGLYEFTVDPAEKTLVPRVDLEDWILVGQSCELSSRDRDAAEYRLRQQQCTEGHSSQEVTAGRCDIQTCGSNKFLSGYYLYSGDAFNGRPAYKNKADEIILSLYFTNDSGWVLGEEIGDLEVFGFSDDTEATSPEFVTRKWKFWDGYRWVVDSFFRTTCIGHDKRVFPEDIQSTEVTYIDWKRNTAAFHFICTGSRVRWYIRDEEMHTVTCLSSTTENGCSRFHSGRLDGINVYYEQTFQEVGTILYQCNFHPNDMAGTLVIQDCSGPTLPPILPPSEAPTEPPESPVCDIVEVIGADMSLNVAVINGFYHLDGFSEDLPSYASLDGDSIVLFFDNTASAWLFSDPENQWHCYSLEVVDSPLLVRYWFGWDGYISQYRLLPDLSVTCYSTLPPSEASESSLHGFSESESPPGLQMHPPSEPPTEVRRARIPEQRTPSPGNSRLGRHLPAVNPDDLSAESDVVSPLPDTGAHAIIISPISSEPTPPESGPPPPPPPPPDPSPESPPPPALGDTFGTMSGSACMDLSWTDIDDDGCEVYEDIGRTSCHIAADYAVNDVDATAACCFCGGGTISSGTPSRFSAHAASPISSATPMAGNSAHSITPVESNVDAFINRHLSSDTTSTTSDSDYSTEISIPSDCVDFDWVDIDGHSCDVYLEYFDDESCQVAPEYAVYGLDALAACCVCGGGTSNAPQYLDPNGECCFSPPVAADISGFGYEATGAFSLAHCQQLCCEDEQCEVFQFTESCTTGVCDKRCILHSIQEVFIRNKYRDYYIYFRQTPCQSCCTSPGLPVDITGYGFMSFKTDSFSNCQEACCTSSACEAFQYTEDCDHPCEVNCVLHNNQQPQVGYFDEYLTFFMLPSSFRACDECCFSKAQTVGVLSFVIAQFESLSLRNCELACCAHKECGSIQYSESCSQSPCTDRCVLHNNAQTTQQFNQFYVTYILQPCYSDLHGSSELGNEINEGADAPRR